MKQLSPRFYILSLVFVMFVAGASVYVQQHSIVRKDVKHDAGLKLSPMIVQASVAPLPPLMIVQAEPMGPTIFQQISATRIADTMLQCHDNPALQHPFTWPEYASAEFTDCGADVGFWEVFTLPNGHRYQYVYVQDPLLTCPKMDLRGKWLCMDFFEKEYTALRDRTDSIALAPEQRN